MRIRAQLVNAHADRHIWADSYERDLNDVIAVQNEIAREIAGQIRVQLTPQEQANLAVAAPRAPEAYEYYFRSRYFINNRRSIDGLRKSVEYSHRPIQADPHYSLAYAGLAHSLISLSCNNGMSSKEAMPQAEAAAKQALELDPSPSQAHVALGWIRTAYDWDWAGAEREIKRALELDPNNPDARRVHAHYLQAIGRTSEAIEEERRSLELDPFSVWGNRNLGRALFFARRYAEAIAQFQKTAEMDPHSAVLFKWIAWCYEKKVWNEKLCNSICATKSIMDLVQKMPKHWKMCYCVLDRSAIGKSYCNSSFTRRKPRCWNWHGSTFASGIRRKLSPG